MDYIVKAKKNRITVTFDMPFMHGDKIIDSYRCTEDEVALIDGLNLRIDFRTLTARTEREGYVYTKKHTQLCTWDAVCPSPTDLINYWLKPSNKQHLHDQLGMIRRFLTDKPVLAAAFEKEIEQRRVKDLVARKAELVARLEETLSAISALAKTEVAS